MMDRLDKINEEKVFNKRWYYFAIITSGSEKVEPKNVGYLFSGDL